MNEITTTKMKQMKLYGMHNAFKTAIERLRYVTAACGDCYECRKQKQRQWMVRMSEENRQTTNAYFLTLTFDDKSYKQLEQKIQIKR